MQQSAQDILQRQGNEKSNRNNDQHHHQARQKFGEHVNQILVSLLDSLDNDVLHGFTSTFRLPLFYQIRFLALKLQAKEFRVRLHFFGRRMGMLQEI